jgi:hypothetical protein
MARAARGCAAGSRQVGAANVDSGYSRWSKTIDPSAVQEIPWVVSENSRLFLLSLSNRLIPQPNWGAYKGRPFSVGSLAQPQAPSPRRLCGVGKGEFSRRGLGG